MCGKKNDEEELHEMEEDNEDSKACGKPSRVLLFIFNFIIWLGSCALLALGIYGLVDIPFTTDVLDVNAVKGAAILLIAVGGIGFTISFIGCCGAFLRNKCLILTYVIVLILLLAILLIGGIVGFMFRNRIKGVAIEEMRKSLSKYRKNQQDTTTNKAWDSMQRSLKCCGVSTHKDWESYNTGFKSGDLIPESCCTIDERTQKTVSGCASASNQRNFYVNAGCHTKITEYLDAKAPYVAIVGAIVALSMILGAILGIVVYNSM